MHGNHAIWLVSLTRGYGGGSRNILGFFFWKQGLKSTQTSLGETSFKIRICVKFKKK